jgi:hypothetical protein
MIKRLNFTAVTYRAEFIEELYSAQVEGALGMIKPHLHVIWCLFATLWLMPGCAQISRTSGVENNWRKPQVVFHNAVTTEDEVLNQLGPPSQIIALPDRTVFYYLFEKTNGKLLFLVLYNQATTHITYDRAIFFFNQDHILEHYALSRIDQ